MGDHHHGHGGGHEDAGRHLPPHLDPSVPDKELRPSELSRRQFLRRLGLLGVAAAGAYVAAGLPVSAFAATTADPTILPENLLWLAGDHHTHTQYSIDARYKVSHHVGAASRFGLDWIVITDHGRDAHEKVSIDKTLVDVVRARADVPGILTFQGLEWNIPAAEHGTVFFAPGQNEAELLHEFEAGFDGVILYGTGASDNDPLKEQKAVEAITWIRRQIDAGRTPAGLFLANHPARRGLDSPHEFRSWIDAGPGISVGMEGAPGHQASSIAKANLGPEVARGYYDFSPTAQSFSGYPLESYRTFGGFDWITATVGGMWDSLLAEGRRYGITANSDSHAVYSDTMIRGAGTGQYDNPDSPYYGAYGDPIDTGIAQAGNGDFWPGYYSKTFVGSQNFSYLGVMEGLRLGRVWVCHGDLIKRLFVLAQGLNVTPATLGGTAVVPVGGSVQVSIKIELNHSPNFNGDVPNLARVDLIAGPVTGPSGNADAMTAPQTTVVRSWDVSGNTNQVVELVHQFDGIQAPMYFRLRGTDGRAHAPGSIEPRLDPVPVDPWSDLWFYSNATFIECRK